MAKPKNTTPQRNDAGPLSGLQHKCTCIPTVVHFVTYTIKQTRDASALHWRPERVPASFRSGVGFLRLSHPCLVCILFQLHSYSKWSFSDIFSLGFCFFLGWGVVKYFQTLSMSPPNTISNCKWMRHLLWRDSLFYSTPNKISHYRQTRLMLGTYTFCTRPETNTFGTID